jgi:FixJ family two-component response regulator
MKKRTKATPPNNDKPVIVLCDDDQEFGAGFCAFFEMNGYLIHHESTVSGLMERVRSLSGKQGIFFLDRLLGPEVTDNVLSEISSDNNHDVIILTAFPTFESSTHALRHQAVDYLVKPVRLDDLLAIVKGIEETKAAPRPVDQTIEDEILKYSYLSKAESTLIAVHKCASISILPTLSNCGTLLGYSIPTVHRNIKKLIENDLLSFRLHKNDGRVKIFHLTDKGLKAVEGLILEAARFQQKQ